MINLQGITYRQFDERWAASAIPPSSWILQQTIAKGSSICTRIHYEYKVLINQFVRIWKLYQLKSMLYY